MLIKVAGIDPSLRNTGLAKGTYNVLTGELDITGIYTQKTEAENGKTVRKSSDDLRCANLLVEATHKWIEGSHAVFAEIPSGSQSARGSFSNGICLGVLGSIGYFSGYEGRLIQVNPLEVKRAATGAKNASKEEMIEWAHEKFPHLSWVITKAGKNKGELSPQNEHMADAVAAINAGVKTDEFRTLVSVIKLAMKSTELLETASN